VHHIGRRILVFDHLPSTNDYAASLVNESDAAGTVIRARSQSAGRGTFGRTWHSPADAGVWVSVILDPPAHLRRPAILTAWAAVSVAEAIRPVIGRQPRIKWPNDVLIGRKKVCGLLIEQGRYTIVGIGLNVNQTADDFAAAELPDATSLTLVIGRPQDVDAVAADVIAALDREYELLLNGELTTLEACWKWRVGLLGRMVKVECYDGRRHHGRLLEMAFDGLDVLTPDGDRTRIIPEEIRQINELSGLPRPALRARGEG
jgi:BirA family transcriptional regulator, biotin operon repressor / biotin---[acetyl-CoA-carboxylase] ligase